MADGPRPPMSNFPANRRGRSGATSRIVVPRMRRQPDAGRPFHPARPTAAHLEVSMSKSNGTTAAVELTPVAQMLELIGNAGPAELSEIEQKVAALGQERDQAVAVVDK